MVITAVLLAAKFFDDAYYNNAYYAKVGGVLVSEMNSLEVEFLFRINFSLRVLPEVFEKYNAELISHANATGLESPPLCPANVSFHAPPSEVEQRVMPQQQLVTPDNAMYASSISTFPPNGTASNYQAQVQQAHVQVAAAAPQAQLYQQQAVNNQFHAALTSQLPLHNLSQITPSPPPHHSHNAYACGGPVAYNTEDFGCNNVAAQHQYPVDYIAQVTGSSNDAVFDLQQKILLSGTNKKNWDDIHQVSNQSSSHQSEPHQEGDLISTPSYEFPMDNGVTDSAYSSSSAPLFSNTQYSNVPFPSLPVTTTPSSSTFSAKSSPGLSHFSDSHAQQLNCAHSNYGCNQGHAMNSQPHVMHQNYADYIQGDVGMAWQRRHSDITAYGNQHPSQYVNNSPQVES